MMTTMAKREKEEIEENSVSDMNVKRKQIRENGM